MPKKRKNLLSFRKLLEKRVNASLSHLEEFTREFAVTVDRSQFDILSVTRVDDACCFTRRFINPTQVASTGCKHPGKLKLFSIRLGKLKLN